MAKVVVMPKLGLTMTEGTVSKWLKKVGDEVKEGDVIALAKEGTLSVNIHASIDGKVSAVTANYVKITK